jgi:hypothetical protein
MTATAVLHPNSPLLERVAIPDRDRPVGKRLTIDCNAKRGSCFVLAAIAASDRPFLIVENVKLLLQLAIEFLGQFRHAILLDQRKDGRLDRGQTGMESQDGPLLGLTIFIGRFVLVYASHRNASVARSAPAEGSMTCGVYRSPVRSSR